jgi:hypothetical protein
MNMSKRSWEGVPEYFHKAYDRAMQGKSRNSAIRAFCHECFFNAKGCQAEIRDCTDKGCPLYLYRPYQKWTGGRKPVESPTSSDAT